MEAAMVDHVKLACLSCGQANRVSAARLGAKPRCGTCGSALVDGGVAEVDPATLARAIGDDLPLLVDFWAPWCGPCRMMAPQFAQAARELAPRVRFAKINTQDHPQESTRRGIRGIPLLIMFHRGRETGRLPGARPAAEIVAFAREHLTAKG
jgi:thioredoxin 2